MFIRNYIYYMKRSRMSVILHVLVHLVQANRVPMTSGRLAECLKTNPVVIRRDLAALRRAGVVVSTPGHGGGWTLAREPKEITVQEVYAAIGEPLIALPAQDADDPGCLLETRVHQALGAVYEEVEALLQKRLMQVTIADLVLDIRRHGCTTAQLDSQEISHGV